VSHTSRLVIASTLSILSILSFAGTASATFSTAPDSTWQANGKVYAVVKVGNTVYIGGDFTYVSKCGATASCPSNTVYAKNVAAFDATTGAAIPSFAPQVGGSGSIVWALAALGGKLFIGGEFDSVNNVPRRNLAALDLTTGALDPDVDSPVGSGPTDRVRALYTLGDHVYLGGFFGSVGSATRRRIAAVDVNGDLLSTFRPKLNAPVRTLGATCDGSSLIVGGDFRQAAGTDGTFQDRATLAMFDPTSGALDPWSPPNAEIPNGVNAFDLAADCSQLFVGYGGSNEIYNFDVVTGAIDWHLKTGGNVQTVAIDGGLVLFGGHFSQVSILGDQGNVRRTRFAVVDFDGVIQNDWVPTFGGYFKTGPWDILVDGSQVWIGGGFSRVSGATQWDIARFTDQP
jgi:trimeric autotransporter adhesin